MVEAQQWIDMFFEQHIDAHSTPAPGLLIAS
jgi:hypothetical protein